MNDSITYRKILYWTTTPFKSTELKAGDVKECTSVLKCNVKFENKGI